MKRSEDRGPFGAWLVEQRQRLSDERKRRVLAQDVVDELRATGYPIDSAYYRGLEGGSKRPGRETREALGRFFGRQPPADQPNGHPDLTDLVAAMRDQTAAINALVLELHSARALGDVAEDAADAAYDEALGGQSGAEASGDPEPLQEQLKR